MKKIINLMQDAIKKGVNVILPDETTVDPEQFLYQKKIVMPNIKVPLVYNPNRVYSTVVKPIKWGKYKFNFIAPKKISDAQGYYSYLYGYGIPNDYIRVCFTTKIADTIIKAKQTSLSMPTWESIKGKYITIYPFKIKEDKEDVQQSIMDEVSDFIKKRIYKNAIITVISVSDTAKEKEEKENTEESVNEK